MPRERAIIAAARRFQTAWGLAMADNGEGLIVAELNIVEVHEAALELIRATETDNLEDALDVLHRYDD